ncbi:MAG TPA: YebC/PmpR family DNA-binding transcriptional regulator [Spirochaeta sp.]|nr:YebC/PmpR family DNA-binding transcriptional regulator [Spirochaeta sp.]
MSGHSKWHTIKHKKGAIDAKRGKIFTKIIKEITVAARMGGGDIESNPRLRTIVLKAKDANMPKDNIARAIKKGSGDLDGVSYTEGIYEGYGVGGVAILVETLTDNKNRTAADVRSIFTKSGGNLGDSGSVAYMFARKGVITLSTETCSEDDVFNAALEAGAEDVATEDSIIEVVTGPEDFEAVRDAIEAAGFKREMAEISMIADQRITLSDDKTRNVLRLIERLEDNDDVQNVYSNMDIPEDFDPDDE